MPAALVIIITLVQENVMELTGEKTSDILLVDQDNSIISEKIKESILETKRINLIESGGSLENGIAKVAQGEVQACIHIPANTSTKLKKTAENLFDPENSSHSAIHLPVYFDPAVLPGFRSGILAMLQLTVLQIEMESKVSSLEAKANEFMGLQGAQSSPPEMGVEPIEFKRLGDNLLLVQEKLTGEKVDSNPSAVQRNIPSWSLFGLFFTCIPLAGSLLIERKSGIWIRLLSNPVSPVTLLIGKIIAYVAVCFFQITLIVLIGRYLFPQLGLPAFILSGDLPSLIIISISCSLAACGYGVFLGSVCSTMEQASMFGSISIVIAAALGGVLVPTYAMPGIMQKISGYSPLNWGLNSYLDVMIRGFTLEQTGNNVLKLIVFFVILLLLSWQLSRRSR